MVRPNASARPPALDARGLAKRYGATHALDDVTFAIGRGEVMAVLGQNGAGKSTLVNALAGVVRLDAGSILVDGEPAALESPRAALQQGIVLIPQELAYVPQLTVAENICLGAWGNRRSLVTHARLRTAAAPFASELGVQRLLDVPMAQLSLAQCQLVEIAKALSRNARVLLLDEPTAALSDTEALGLFAALDALRQRGVSMLYISHRIDEVLSITDRLLVLRDGRIAADRPTKGATRRDVIDSMLGGSATTAPTHDARKAAGAPLLALRGVGHRGRGLTDIDLEIHRGEIVGLFGVAGAGHETLAMALAGRMPHDRGELMLDGRACGPIRTPRHARRRGIGYVPPERKTQGVILAQSVRHNVAFPHLSRLARFGVMRRRAEERLVRTAAARMHLQYSGSAQPVGHLSGGNQQKVLLASRVYAASALLVIQEPSRGVDVGARVEIHALLRDLARGGQTIVFATADVEEAVALSDRLLVFRDGRVRATLEHDAKTEAAALEAAGRSDLER